VIIRRESPGTFSIGVGAGQPQIVCRTFEEALQRASSFASREDVHLWYSTTSVESAPLADVVVLRRIWNEYVEMPGLRLTREQAQRLLALDAERCALLLDALVDLKFLARGHDGKYARGAEAFPVVPRPPTTRPESVARALRHAG
jgi:hypothetical protein